MGTPSIKTVLVGLEIAAAPDDVATPAIGLTSLHVPTNLADGVSFDSAEGSIEHSSTNFALHPQSEKTFAEPADSFVFQSALSITIEPPSTDIASLDATRDTITSLGPETGTITATNFGHGTVTQFFDAPSMGVGPTSTYSSAASLAAVGNSSGGDSGLTMMCGCAACVASRDGDTGSQPDQNFLALDSQPMVADGVAGAEGMVSAAAPGYAINALLAGSKWGSFTLGAPATVTYSFLTSIPSYYGFTDPTFQTMNAAQRQAALDAFAMYSQVANITFTQVAPGTGSINLGVAFLGTNVGGGAWYPRNGYAGNNDNSIDGDVWITNHSTYVNPTPGSWAYQTFIHEIGHAIGMKHPGNYNAGGGGTPGPYLPTGEDNHKYTVMSYYSQPGYSGIAEPITPQLYDIATIQYLYGANYSTRSGNDTYTFSTSLQIKTIWDGGGTDTFDTSNQASAVSLDLHDGAFSSISGSSNIAIAYGAIIENAIGSNYNDTIVSGNSGSTITGGRGNDTLVGGSGSDTAIYSGNRASYQVNRQSDGSVQVVDNRGAGFDGTDMVRNFEYLRFADTTISAMNRAPATTSADQTVTRGQVIAMSSIFSAVDADGDTITRYQFADGTPSTSSGHFTVNGVAQGANVVIEITAAQLVQTTFDAGTIADFAGVRSFDGMDWGAWSFFDINIAGGGYINSAPVTTSTDTIVTPNQVIAASSLFAVTDDNGDTITRYQFADGTPSASSGHFTVNGVVQAANVVIDLTPAQLAQTTFNAGTTSDFAGVRSFDGVEWSAWSFFNVNVSATLVNHAPVVTTTNQTATAGQVIAASTIFSVSDADGNTITKYQFADGNDNALSGYFTVNGATQPANFVIDVSAAQLAQTNFVAGSLADLAGVRAFDGTEWSAWSFFNVNVSATPVNHAPVVTTTNQTATAGQVIAASTIFSVSDADGNTITKYQFADGNDNALSGYFTVNGATQPANFVIDVSAAQLAQTNFVAGSLTDLAGVRAFDGTEWSAWTFFNVGSSSSPAGAESAAALTVAASGSIAAETLLEVNKIDFQAPDLFEFKDLSSNTNSGHFIFDGVAQGANTTIHIDAQHLEKISFVAGSAGMTDEISVRFHDNHGWGDWHLINVTGA